MRILWLTFLLVLSCDAQPTPTKFSEAVLSETYESLDGNKDTFKSILNQFEGKTIVIDVWASWCKDCILGLPKVKALQYKYPEVAFLFLSLDKNKKNWKKGINRYEIVGTHYYIGDNWDGVFGKFVDLDWIPRYMVVDTEGNIKLFKAIKADDESIKKALQN